MSPGPAQRRAHPLRVIWALTWCEAASGIKFHYFLFFSEQHFSCGMSAVYLAVYTAVYTANYRGMYRGIYREIYRGKCSGIYRGILCHYDITVGIHTARYIARYIAVCTAGLESGHSEFSLSFFIFLFSTYLPVGSSDFYDTQHFTASMLWATIWALVW